MPAKTDEAPDIEPIVVLDLIMPNGKRMRDCTGADMKKFGDLLLKRRQSPAGTADRGGRASRGIVSSSGSGRKRKS
jgi:hypothetical protein